MVVSDSDFEFVEPQTLSRESGVGVGQKMDIEGPRKSCARVHQEKTLAAQFALQSSARLYAKQSIAFTRGNAFATDCNVAWPTKGPIS